MPVNEHGSARKRAADQRCGHGRVQSQRLVDAGEEVGQLGGALESDVFLAVEAAAHLGLAAGQGVGVAGEEVGDAGEGGRGGLGAGADDDVRVGGELVVGQAVILAAVAQHKCHEVVLGMDVLVGDALHGEAVGARLVVGEGAALLGREEEVGEQRGHVGEDEEGDEHLEDAHALDPRVLRLRLQALERFPVAQVAEDVERGHGVPLGHVDGRIRPFLLSLGRPGNAA